MRRLRRQIWWTSLALMIFLPASLWKGGHEREGAGIRVTVRAVATDPTTDLQQVNARRVRAGRSRGSQPSRVPGPSQAD